MAENTKKGIPGWAWFWSIVIIGITAFLFLDGPHRVMNLVRASEIPTEQARQNSPAVETVEEEQNIALEAAKEDEGANEDVASQGTTPERVSSRPRRRLPVVTDNEVRQQASGSCASVDWQQPRTNPGPRPASFTREESRQLARYIVDKLFQECEGAPRPEYWPIDKRPAPPGELDCLETTPFGSEVCWIVRQRADQQVTLEGGE